MVNVLVAIWRHSFLTLPLTAQKVFVSEFNQNYTYHIMSYYDVFSHMEIKFFHNLLFAWFEWMPSELISILPEIKMLLEFFNKYNYYKQVEKMNMLIFQSFNMFPFAFKFL